MTTAPRLVSILGDSMELTLRTVGFVAMLPDAAFQGEGLITRHPELF